MTLLHQHINTIERLCVKHSVKQLYAFGSVVTGNLKPESDVDLLVSFEPLSLNAYADNYFDLKFALEDALHRPVDLLEEQAIRNPFLKETIAASRQLIYGKND